MRKSSPKPWISFSSTRAKASGVTSRPVMPVPPVVMTQSTDGSAIQRRSTASIRSASSFSISRVTQRCPAASILCCSVSPERSEARSRVSETVSTAMFTGRKVRLSSIGMGALLRLLLPQI
jgi:hypothetical protein